MSESPFEGLRERKKREMRQLISDTATRMFMERGFDAVKVSEIAAFVGVSEKTVYNYFPTKESLLLDREEMLAARMRIALGPGAVGSPVEGMVKIIEEDLTEITGFWTEQDDTSSGPQFFRRFREVIEETPSLRAAARDMQDRISRVAAESMAERAGLSPEDPEPVVAAQALTALWMLYYESLSRHVHAQADSATAIALTMDDIHRAARMLDSGLWSFGLMMQASANREQMAAASAAAQKAGKQVVSALKQAHSAWRESQRDMGGSARQSRKAQLEAIREMQRSQGEVMRAQTQSMREQRLEQRRFMREQLRNMKDDQKKR